MEENAFHVCDVCGKDYADCECKTCPNCETVGSPSCFPVCSAQTATIEELMRKELNEKIEQELLIEETHCGVLVNFYKRKKSVLFCKPWLEGNGENLALLFVDGRLSEEGEWKLDYQDEEAFQFDLFKLTVGEYDLIVNGINIKIGFDALGV